MRDVDPRAGRRSGSADQGTVGRWRAQRQRALDAYCDGLGGCGHSATLPLDPAWPDALPIARLRRRLVCRCGRREPTVIPAWRLMENPPGAWAITDSVPAV